MIQEKKCSHQQICREPGADMHIFKTTYIFLYFHVKFVDIRWFGIFDLPHAETRPKRPT